MDDFIREAIQQLLDNCGDGWSVAQYAVSMWIERVEDGGIHTEPWLWVPPGQSDCHTKPMMYQCCALQPSSQGLTPESAA